MYKLLQFIALIFLASNKIYVNYISMILLYMRIKYSVYVNKYYIYVNAQGLDERI